jgi:hypothetical protein
MAKALFGHTGLGPDLRLTAEVRRLRGRVAELEAELDRLREVNEALVDSVALDRSAVLNADVLAMERSEPAYS